MRPSCPARSDKQRDAISTSLPGAGTSLEPDGLDCRNAGDGDRRADRRRRNEQPDGHVRSAATTLHTSSLSGHVFVDVDETGTFTAGDTAVVGKTVT